MTGSMGSTMQTVHKPTVGTVIALVLVLFVLYHFTLGKKH